MRETLFISLGCDYLVAEYALTLTHFQGVEAAAEFIFGQDDTGNYKHPFVSFIPSQVRIEDFEYEFPEVCFVCKGEKSKHFYEVKRQLINNSEVE